MSSTPSAWIVDTWTKTRVLPDGTRQTPTAAQLKNLNNLPPEFKSKKFKQGSRWMLRWVDPDTGKTRQKSFATRRAAEHARKNLAPTRAGSERTLFSTIAEEWLATKHDLKPASIWRYKRELNNYVYPQWADKPIQSISRKQVNDWVRALLEGTAKYKFAEGSNRTTRPLSPAYVRHIVGRTFAAVMKYAREENLISDNPVERVQLPRVSRSTVPDIPHIDHAEIDRLAAEAETISNTPDLSVLIYLLTYTGLRIGEALALTVNDLDLTRRTLTVRRTWTTTDTGARTLGPPKTGGARTVPIPNFLVKKLATLVDGRHHAEYVFQTRAGHPLNDTNFRNRVWRQAQQAAGFKIFIRVHDLRHLAATYAIQAGADVKTVQKMLGHASATITLDTYSHLFEQHHVTVADKISAARDAALNQ